MLLSEAIARFQALREEYGDLPVYHDGCGEYQWQPIDPSVTVVTSREVFPDNLIGKMVVLI